MWFEPSTVRVVRDAFPEWMSFVWAIFSYFGSVWFVAPAIVLCFLFGPRDRFAPWLGTVIAGYAVMVASKGYFSIDRPGYDPHIDPTVLPVGIQHVYAPLVEVSTTSFPSGHAIAGTIIWTMLALELDVGTKRVRLAAAAAMILAVGFSRIAVGLHFPIDVVVGTLIGLALVAGILAIRRFVRERSDPHAETTAVFAAVAVISLLAFVVGGRIDAAALFGGSIGALAAWRYAPPPADPWQYTLERTIHGLVGIVILAAGASVLLLTDVAVVWFGAGIFAGALIVGLPRLVEVTLESDDRDVRVGS